MNQNSIHRRYYPAPFTAISIEDDFWAPKLNINRECTIPIEYRQCKETGRIDAFRLNWKPGQPNQPHIFWDSDVAKWIEAAAYSLATHADPELDNLLDEVIKLIASAQQSDGYLNTHFTVVEPEKRWANLRDWHELYCAGHMIEAGVAHFQATGKRSLLDVVCRYADYIASIFGTGPGQKRGYCGHEEIELALVKLYHITGEKRYLALSQYFIDERGRQPYYYDLEAQARGEDPAKFWGAKDTPPERRYAYMQAYLPVREQREVTGHAVRAMYLYSAMADLANDTGDEGLLKACEALWEDVCLRKMYITGGIGPSRHNEGFTTPYDLPNETAYAETCAAVGLVFWNHRMLQFACDNRYADVMERALYNGTISGISLDGQKFFYENPLASLGNHHRQGWFDCACCPPNIARLLASLGQYVYSQSDRGEVAVHLFVQGKGKLMIDGQNVVINQKTRYPWEGVVTLRLEMDRQTRFGLRLRLPGWCRSANLWVNDKPVEMESSSDRGYLRIERVWHPGDSINFEMDMPVERIHAHPNIRQDVGLVALQRGPVVYCLEEVDNPVPLQRICLPEEVELTTRFEPGLLGGVTVIEGLALAYDDSDWQGSLYRTAPPGMMPCAFTAIPYYAWDNRKPGQMRVWLPSV